MSDETERSAQEQVRAERTREHLRRSRSARQLAIAEFPLRIFSEAELLRSLCHIRDRGDVVSDDQHALMQRLENNIKNTYYHMFGVEMGDFEEETG